MDQQGLKDPPDPKVSRERGVNPGPPDPQDPQDQPAPGSQSWATIATTVRPKTPCCPTPSSILEGPTSEDQRDRPERRDPQDLLAPRDPWGLLDPQD